MNKAITISREGNTLQFTRPDDHKTNRSMHGLYRSLVNNMVTGVTKGLR